MNTDILLSVNLNKVALMRNARGGTTPNVVEMARLCLDSGAGGLTLHPRPDARHATYQDCIDLALLTRDTEYELNVEGNPMAEPRGVYPGLTKIVAETNCEQCTLVPDSDSQLTSDHGWDTINPPAELRTHISNLKDIGTRVCVFLDPIAEMVVAAHNLGADGIELYTGPLIEDLSRILASEMSQDERTSAIETLIKPYSETADEALNLGMRVNAGHDLALPFLPHIVDLPGLKEVSIGQALVADALKVGFPAAIKAYLQALNVANI